MATVAVSGLGIALRIGRGDWCLLAFAAGLVWMAEAFNTALEILADEVSLDRRGGIGKAKDVAAGAVLVAAATAVIIGALVFLPVLLGPEARL